MVNGLDLFRERFEDFDNCYAIIGGTACSILMEQENFEFRATQDIDMILIVDSPDFNDFTDKLLSFIDDGEYSCEERANGTKRLYRFKEPNKKGFPSMIELFSKNILNMKGKRRITYVKTDKEPSGLSAMLLSDSYYNFAMQGREKIDGVWTIQAAYLLPLKMYAWLNFQKDENLKKSASKEDMLKHKYDVFRLLPLIPEGLTIDTNKELYEDIKSFIEKMQYEELPAESIFGDWATTELRENFNKNNCLNKLKEIYLSNHK